jgi:hypothetical protein
VVVAVCIYFGFKERKACDACRQASKQAQEPKRTKADIFVKERVCRVGKERKVEKGTRTQKVNTLGRKEVVEVVEGGRGAVEKVYDSRKRNRKKKLTL